MKKTIFALLSLVGVAMGTTTEFTITRGESATWGSATTPGTGITFTDTDDTLTLTYLYTSMGTGGSASVSGSWETPTNAKYAGSYAPKVQLQSGSADSWSLTFSVTNSGEKAITLNQITLDTYGINGGGGDKNAYIEITPTLTHVNTLTDVKTVYNNSNFYINPDDTGWVLDTTGTSTVFNLDYGGRTHEACFKIAQGLTLDAGKSATLTFTLSSPKSYNTFAGLTGGSVSYTTASASVPEPTTATLSLLALAGLAMRRRRK